MRIRNISITIWRHFSNIEMDLENDSGLVCVVGANGTGKSHLLELISACAHKLGLSQGVEIPRGNPFADPHNFSLTFFIAPGISDAVDIGLADTEAQFPDWDRTLKIHDSNLPDHTAQLVTAGGIQDAAQATEFAKKVVQALKGAKDVYFLSLDADRAYPKRTINIHEIAQAYETDWEDLEHTRGRSYKQTATLYDEWIKYFLAQENQSGTRLLQAMRRAKNAQEKPPGFSDHFEEYASSLQKVLPHLVFTGVDAKKRTLLFDTTGLELTFDQLSGGEREIAFLVGQIDRFGLRNGLFLIDEPELHLNADLIRSWVGYLTGTVETGQVWLATHSLEAVEAAGQHATFVLERNDETRQVDCLSRLDSRPVLSALSRAVGTPAFSMSQLRFVFVEGEENVGERERFRKLAGTPNDVRFLECGSCNEVKRRVEAVKQLAMDDEIHMRIGGIVDRDFRPQEQVSALSDAGLHVLEVHEVENYFLHPGTLKRLLEQNGHAEIDPVQLVCRHADSRAGSWIFQFAFATNNEAALPKVSTAAKDCAKGLSWGQLEADRVNLTEEIVDRSGFDGQQKNRLRSIFDVAVSAYCNRRGSDDLWKFCEGKQVLNQIARDVGFSDSPALIRAVFAAWGRDDVDIPIELVHLRDYLNSL